MCEAMPFGRCERLELTESAELCAKVESVMVAEEEVRTIIAPP